MGMLELRLDKKQNEWFVVESEEELRKLIKTAKGKDIVGNVIYPEEQNRSDYKVAVKWLSRTEKLLYLSYRSNSLSAYTIVQAINAFNRVDSLEKELGKDIGGFDKSDVEKYILSVYNGFNLDMIQTDIRIFDQYCQEIEKRKINPWVIVDLAKMLSILRKSDIDIINRTQLKEMFDYIGSPQLFLPILLAYEGVNISTNEDIMEASWVKVKDIGDHTLTIKDKTGGMKRIIELDDWSYKIILAASKQEVIAVVRGKSEVYDKLRSSSYLIKKSDGSSVNGVGNHAPYSVIYYRLQAVKDLMRARWEDIKLTPRNITHSGEMYYIDKYVSEGAEVKEAVEMMFHRFGHIGTTNSPDAYRRKVKRMINKYKSYKKE